MKNLAIATVVLLVAFTLRAATYVNYCLMTSPGTPKCGGVMYGYKNSSTGAGDDAFDRCLAVATENLVPLVIMYGSDNCSTCSSFANTVNSMPRTFSMSLGGIRSVYAYMRGNDSGTGPAACVAAKKFFNKLAAIEPKKAAVPGTCHMVGMYGVFENGEEFARASKLPTTYDSWASTLKKWSDEYYTLKPLKVNNLWIHVPCKHVSLAEGVLPLYVPLERTNNVTTVEKNNLKVLCPDGTAFMTNVIWSGQGSRSTRQEVALPLAWQKDAEYRLVLMSTNDHEIATNVIRCVRAEENGFDNPRFVSETNGYSFGEWTLDFNAATGGVLAANSYVQVDTGTVQRAVEVAGSRQTFDWSTSNRYETVYTNDWEFFKDKTETEFKWEFAFAATNLETTIFTNDVRLFEQTKVGETAIPRQIFKFTSENSIVTNFVVNADEVGITNSYERWNWSASATNRCDYIVSQDDAKTNRFATVLVSTDWPYTVTNTVVNLLTNEQHTVEAKGTPVRTVITNVVGYADGRNVYYKEPVGTIERTYSVEIPCEIENRVITNYVDTAAGVKPPETNEVGWVSIYTCTNRQEYIVSPDGVMTNAWGEPQVAHGLEASFQATNTVCYALTNAMWGTGVATTNVFSTVTKYATAVGTNVYHTTSVGTNMMFDVAFKTNYPSRRVYAVCEDKTKTNLVSSVNVEKTYEITATNRITYVWTKDKPHVVQDVAESVSKTFYEPDTNRYYLSWGPDAVPQQSVEKRYCGANEVYYLFQNSSVTNASAGTYTTRKATQCFTNFLQYVYSEQSSNKVEYADYCGNKFTLALTNTYTRVETNVYQYGYNDEIKDAEDFGTRKGRSDKGIQSYTLAVSGSSTKDTDLQQFAKNVFASTNFMSWATNNNVALVLLDRPMSGHSLLNHQHTDGCGCYISRKGLRAYKETKSAENDDVEYSAEEMMDIIGGWDSVYRKKTGDEESAQFVLIRPNGKVAGRLNPQYNADGTCDAAENVARLNELLLEATDETEEANGDNGTPLTFEWGKVKSGQTLAVSDTEDWYRLTGDYWAGKRVLFEVKRTTKPEADIGDNLHAEVVVNGEVLPPSVDYFCRNAEVLIITNYNFTNFTPEDFAKSNVFVKAVAFNGAEVSAGIYSGDSRFQYELSASAFQGAPGVASFLGEGDVVIQDQTNKIYNVNCVRLLGDVNVVSATVDVCEAETTNFNFEATTVVWRDGEGGTNAVKSVNIELLGRDEATGMKSITLKMDVTQPEVDKKVAKLYDKFTISYGCEPTEAGELILYADDSVHTKAGDGIIYVRYDETIWDLLRVYVKRTGGHGPATGYLALLSGGKILDRVTLDWEEYKLGDKTMFWSGRELPKPNVKTGYSDATVKLTTADGFAISNGYDKVSVRVLAKDAPQFAPEAVRWDNAVQYVAFSNAVCLAQALPTGWTVQGAQSLSGSLPKGLSATADKTTGALVIKGTPTAPGETATSVWWMKFKDAQGNVVMSSPVTLTIKVTMLSKDETTGEGLIPGFDAARSWTGLPLVDAKTKRLDGLLDMTVAKNGRTTARWRKAGGKSVSFSAASLTGSLQHKTAGTNVSVKVEKTQSGVRSTFVVYFWTDGRVTGQATEYNAMGKVVDATFTVPGAKVWSKDNPADAWAGNYTLAFPHDDGAFDEKTLCKGPTTLRVKFDTDAMMRTGKATYAGTLPNGKSVSGTATLVPTDAATDDWAQLPIFFSCSTDTFGALVALPQDDVPVAAAKEATNFWTHVESKIEAASYDNEYYVSGVRYEAENWGERWAEDYGTNVLCFAVDGEDTGARVKANKTSLSVVDRGDVALGLQLNRTSGIAAGTLKMDTTGTGRLSTLTWRGVALPGMPDFMLGAYSYNTNFWYNDGKSKRSVKAGGEVLLTVQPK